MVQLYKGATWLKKLFRTAITWHCDLYNGTTHTPEKRVSNVENCLICLPSCIPMLQHVAGGMKMRAESASERAQLLYSPQKCSVLKVGFKLNAKADNPTSVKRQYKAVFGCNEIICVKCTGDAQCSTQLSSCSVNCCFHQNCCNLVEGGKRTPFKGPGIRKSCKTH